MSKPSGQTSPACGDCWEHCNGRGSGGATPRPAGHAVIRCLSKIWEKRSCAGWKRKNHWRPLSGFPDRLMPPDRPPCRSSPLCGPSAPPISTGWRRRQTAGPGFPSSRPRRPCWPCGARLTPRSRRQSARPSTPAGSDPQTNPGLAGRRAGPRQPGTGLFRNC